MDIIKTEVFGWEAAFRGLRNPMNSHAKADSYYNDEGCYVIGPNDMDLAKRMINGGAEERKFLRMIHVQCDINMPRYWWSEADTYHFNTKNSTSTMHKLLNNKNPITLDMFIYCIEDEDIATLVVSRLEELRQKFKNTKNGIEQIYLLLRAKRILMEGFLQLRTWDSNYEEVWNMYKQRRHHRLKEEWQDIFCKWAESLPYFKEFFLEANNE